LLARQSDAEKRSDSIYFKFQGKTNIKAAWFALFE